MAAAQWLVVWLLLRPVSTDCPGQMGVDVHSLHARYSVKQPDDTSGDSLEPLISLCGDPALLPPLLTNDATAARSR